MKAEIRPPRGALLNLGLAAERSIANLYIRTGGGLGKRRQPSKSTVGDLVQRCLLHHDAQIPLLYKSAR